MCILSPRKGKIVSYLGSFLGIVHIQQFSRGVVALLNFLLISRKNIIILAGKVHFPG